MGAEPAVEPHPHALRPLHRDHLRGENMPELGGAAAEGERTEPADRAGMAVGNRMRRTRQDDAHFRRDDVADALLAIVDVEQPDAVLAATFAHRLDEGGASGIGGLVAAGLGGDGVILHGKREIGAAHRAPLLFELREGVMRVQFVQHVAIDIEQIAAVGALPDPMKIPDFVEQRARHCVPTDGFLPARGASGAS